MTSEEKWAAKWLAVTWGLWVASLVIIAVWTKEWPLLALIPAFIIPLAAGMRFMLTRNQERRRIAHD